MTVREVLEAAREAAIEMRRIDEQWQTRLLALGPGGHTYDVHSKVGILDPMRHIDELIDWQDEQVNALNLRQPVEEARQLLVGIGKITDPFTVEIAERYYLNAESWREIARTMEGRRESLSALQRDEQVIVLSKALENCVEQWNRVGIAHLKEMGR